METLDVADVITQILENVCSYKQALNISNSHLLHEKIF